MRHLQARPPEAALDVEALIRLAAVQYTLVTSHTLRYEVKGLYDLQAELLALLILRHGDIFDVSDLPKIVDTTSSVRTRSGNRLLRMAVRPLTIYVQQSVHRSLQSSPFLLATSPQ